MRLHPKPFYLPLLLLFAFSCGYKENKDTEQIAQAPPAMDIQYAKEFKVTYQNGYKLVEVPHPYEGAEKGFKYLLIPRGSEPPAHDADVQVIEIPLKDIVCTSTSHIPLLDYLNETKSLVGFPTTDYISSEKMRKRIDAGKVKELGIDNKMNMEILLDLNPDAVMAYTLTGDYGQFKKLQQAGIPVILNAEYLEKHPLGRAEWIKFMALFFNKEELADSIFKDISNTYTSLKEKADSIKDRPRVYSGIVYGDTWFLPGGNNNAAKLLHDAGYDYLWSDTEARGALELSFEAVYEKAHDADYWIGVGGYNSLEEIKNADARYADFKAYKTGQVYSYEGRKGAKGGSEFLELGYLRPDLVLADLIRIAHPALVPDHNLYFYKQLK